MRNTARPASDFCKQRIERADQPVVGRDVHRHHVLEHLRLDMAHRRERAEQAGIRHQHVEPAVALVEREPKPVDAVVVFQVERHERRGAARLDRVVKLLEPADGARDRHHMRAGLRQSERGCVADAARGAGDERDAVGEGFDIFTPSFRGPCEARSPNRITTICAITKGSGYGSRTTRCARFRDDASRQLASASSDSCRGAWSLLLWSVSGVG